MWTILLLSSEFIKNFWSRGLVVEGNKRRYKLNRTLSRFALCFSLVCSFLSVEGGGLDFCYDEPYCGPATWGQFDPVCQFGNFQSPINLEKSRAKKLPKSVNLVLSKEYAYVQSPFYMRNNGHTVAISFNNEVTSPCLIKGNGFLPNGPYFFSSMHFHWGPDDFVGSEHTIDGKAFPLELHMIHKQSSNWNKFAVISVLYQISENDNPALTPIVENLYLVKEYRNDTLTQISPAYTLNLTQFLPKKIRMFRYQGSFTTPTCNEGVVWTVFDEIQHVSSRQVMAFRNLLQRDGNPLRGNYRPVQPAFTAQRKNIYYMKSVIPSAVPVKRKYG